MIARIRSLYDLRTRAATDPRYAELASLASANLGGPREPLDAAHRWLETNANECGEPGVVEEVNALRDLMKPPVERCGSGWTNDRCTKKLGHRGVHSNEAK